MCSLGYPIIWLSASGRPGAGFSVSRPTAPTFIAYELREGALVEIGRHEPNPARRGVCSHGWSRRFAIATI